MAVNDLILAQSEAFLVSAIKEGFPTAEADQIDLRPGTPQYDLFVRPFLPIVARITDLINQANRKTTPLNYAELTKDELGAIGSRFFLTFNSGFKSSGSVRVKLKAPAALTFGLTDKFTAADNVYYPSTTVQAVAEDLVYEPVLDYYYLDVTLTAESTGTSYDAAVGQIFEAVRLAGDDNLIEVVSVTPFSGGADEETNQEFAARIQTASVTRNLVNSTSIEAKLLDKFGGTIQRLLVVGYQEPEMLRDNISVVDPQLGPINLHIGGHTDIYVRTPIVRTSVEFFIQPGQYSIDMSDYRALLKVHSVSVKDNPNVTPYFELRNTTPALRFSANDTVELFVDPGLTNETIVVDMSYAPDVVEINEFVNSPEERILNSNTLVRYFHPVFLGASIYVEGYDATTQENNPLTLIQLYLNSLPSAATGVVVSKITEAIHAGDVAKVVQDFDLVGQVIYGDGSIAEYTSDVLLAVPDNPGKGFTQRIATWVNEGIVLIPLD